MGRPRKNERIDDIEDDRDDRDKDRDQDREMFEQQMFSDGKESALYIPREDWPEGFALRWIRVEAANAPDHTNWSAKTRMGWSPVLRGKYPRLDARFPSVPMPGMEAQQNQAIIFGGLCLCLRDMRLEKRDKLLQQKETAEAQKTIETYVEGGSAAVPRFNQSGPVQYERAVAPVQFKE